eukprot:jgi/Galph1/5913/GphlegSOOS_G4559.1
MDDDLFTVFDGNKRKRPQDTILKAMETAHVVDEDSDGHDTSGQDDTEQAVSPADSNMRMESPKKEENQNNDFRQNQKKPNSFRIRVEVPLKGNDSSENDLKTNCIHDVSVPPDYSEYNFEPLADWKIEKPAKEYKFSLDAFQRESIKCLERNESVLVSAHTSAGKTAIAEYAVAMSLRDGQRVIYTSPIKALSNQKYRELFEEFTDVGLMTGDVTINPSAGCLVMTTEILRSMLYRGSEIIREVAWVIFDEVHYMRDKERGVVWEETIIMVPENVRFVFLSATIPNAREFAEWIVQLKKQPCHTIYTDSRPVPLQHYLFPAGGDGLYLVVDERGHFRDENFEKALTKIGENTDKDRKSLDSVKKRKGNAKGVSDVYRLIRLIMDREYDPVIVFAFSRRECEALALQLANLELNTDEQKSLVEQVFVNAMDSLSEQDKKLPQITAALPLLRRGIGIHHSGLLPILKEVTEILFQEGLIKVLFATETFAMGLNMPAKTVVFTAVRKFDGESFRFISGGEYIQMSGRAGRRGLDERGISILTVDERIQPETARSILKGNADPLLSSFHLEYNMLLNLLRSEEANPEYVISRSLAQFQADRALPENEKKLQDLQKEKDKIRIDKEEEIREFVAYKDQLERLRTNVRQKVFQPMYALPFLQPGRLARFCIREDEVQDFGWGVVVNFSKRSIAQMREQGNREKFMIDAIVLSKPWKDSNGEEKGFIPPKDSQDESVAWNILPFPIGALDALSSIRVYMPKDLRPKENRAAVGKSVVEVIRRFPAGIPLLDPIEDMGIKDEEFRKLISQVETLEDQFFNTKVAKEYSLSDRNNYPEELCRQLDAYKKREEMETQLKAVRRQIRLGKGLILRDELKRMLRVLRRLGFINQENVVERKGRTACEVNTADELVLTELMFHGVFNEMKSEVTVALLSCFVYDEKQDDQLQFSNDDLKHAFQTLQTIARRVGTVTKECKIPIDVDEYVQSFDPSMMNVVYVWCKGSNFAEICKMTNIFEGSIIRCMRRLEELLRQLCAAAHSIGNQELEQLFGKVDDVYHQHDDMHWGLVAFWFWGPSWEKFSEQQPLSEYSATVPLHDSEEAVLAPFLYKLFELLSEGSNEAYIQWAPTEDGFEVHNPTEFAHQILPRYYKHSNFSSFVRQLNQYGFRKVNRERWLFRHPFFKKGRKDLLYKIVRRRSQQQAKMANPIASKIGKSRTTSRNKCSNSGSSQETDTSANPPSECSWQEDHKQWVDRPLVATDNPFEWTWRELSSSRARQEKLSYMILSDENKLRSLEKQLWWMRKLMAEYVQKISAKVEERKDGDIGSSLQLDSELLKHQRLLGQSQRDSSNGKPQEWLRDTLCRFDFWEEDPSKSVYMEKELDISARSYPLMDSSYNRFKGNRPSCDSYLPLLQHHSEDDRLPTSGGTSVSQEGPLKTWMDKNVQDELQVCDELEFLSEQEGIGSETVERNEPKMQFFGDGIEDTSSLSGSLDKLEPYW